MKGLTSLIAVILLAAGLSACSGDGATALEAAARQPAERPAAALAEPQNGWWWNPAESGSGYAIEQQGNQLFMAGFMYEASGASTWYVSTLTRQSQGSYSGAMTRYSGGQTLLGAYQSPTSTALVANASLSFDTATTGSLTLNFADGNPQRVVVIQRFPISTPTAFLPSNATFDSGWWWNPAEGGRGFFIEVQGGQAFIGSFMYDAAGQPSWYVSNASLQGGQTLTASLLQYTGGQAVGGSYRTPSQIPGTAGTVTFSFSTSSSGRVLLPDGKSVPVSRFSFNPALNGTANLAPNANAGFAQNVATGARVTLDASASTDPNTDSLSYAWSITSKPAGSSGSLSSATDVKPTFTADQPGTYQFSLTVTDSKASSAPASVAITAAAVVAPVIYTVLFTHIEDNTPSGTLGSAAARTSYLQWRDSLLHMGLLARSYNMTWVVQPDWKFLEAALLYEDAATMANTGGLTLLRYLRDYLGAVIDPHSHESGGYNYTDVAYLLGQLGIGGSTVIGGHVWDPALPQFAHWERFRAPVAGQHYPSASWRGDILMGAGTPNHTSDPIVSGVWRPQDPYNFFVDDPGGNIASVGAYRGDMAGVTTLRGLYTDGQVPTTCMLTNTLHINPSMLSSSSSLATVESDILRPLQALRTQGQVDVTDFTRLIDTWKTRFASRACVRQE